MGPLAQADSYAGWEEQVRSKLRQMIQAIMNLLLGCHHRRITRPITPVRKASLERGVTYVACLDCGQEFQYDLATMSMGTVIPQQGTPERISGR